MWEQEESGRVRTPFEPVVLFATLAMIPVIIIQADATSDTWTTFAEVANWLIWAVFAVQIAVVLVVATRKRAALRAHWLDVAIVVVTLPAYGQLLSSIRLVRLVRLLRLLRATVIITRALQAERRLTSASAFRFVSLATIFLTVIAGAVQATMIPATSRRSGTGSGGPSSLSPPSATATSTRRPWEVASSPSC